jgi:hypothetical protein
MKTVRGDEKRAGHAREGVLKKQIAGALVASMLIASVPGWAEGENATRKAAVDERAQSPLRDSIDRAVDRAPAGEPAQAAPEAKTDQPEGAGPQLTPRERQDLAARHDALKTDPVARGTAGIVMGVLGAALSIGLTAYFINKSKSDSSTTPTAGMARR